MKPEMNEREVNALVELARCWCETNAAYREQFEMLRPGDHEAMRQYLNYLDVRIQAMKHGRNTETKRRGSHKVIPLSTYMSWRAAK